MSTRSTRKGRKKKPNAAFYVGYVEDDETPEMIMKKFAALEKVISHTKKVNAEKKQEEEPSSSSSKKKKSDKAEMSDSDDEDDPDSNKNKNEPEQLTEEQLISLFNETSYYSVNSLQRNNDIMFTKQKVDEDGWVVELDDPNYEELMFEVDYNATELVDWMKPEEDAYVGEDEFFEDDKDDKEERAFTKLKGTSRKRSTYSRGTKKARYGGFQGHGIGSSSLRNVGGGDGKKCASRQKLLCHEPFYLKVPAYPIPRSWVKSIALYDNRDISEYIGYTYMEKDILSMVNATDYIPPNKSRRDYRAILMDPPFDLSDSVIRSPSDIAANNGHVTLSEFAKLPIGQLITKTGMLFMWVPSEITMEINNICTSWGFALVEHATWIVRNLSYQIENRESKLLGLSKKNLLLFRKLQKNGKNVTPIEMRHQRTSDSYFDFMRYNEKTGRGMMSNYHYKVIETMLPDLDEKEKGEALYLWAPKDEKRNGWQMVVDTKYLQILEKTKPTDINKNDW